MNIIKKLEDSIWAKVILAVVVVVIAFAARSMLENKHEESKIDKQTAGKTIRETSYAETVPEDDPILNVFKNAYPTAEVLLACREDVTDDAELVTFSPDSTDMSWMRRIFFQLIP